MNDKPIVALVVLNYNDEELAVSCIQSALKLKSVDKIVIVDNCSDEYQRLVSLTSDSVAFIRNKYNSGYAAGNNIGIRYAIEHFGANYIVISNPDVSFEDNFIYKALSVFKSIPDTGQVACIMKTKKQFFQAKKLPSILGMMASNIPPLDRSRWVISYPMSYFKRNICRVGQVWGSLFMLSRESFIAIGGLDEDTFLYYEEAILGRRLERAGYATYLITDCSFEHGVSVSICKSISSAQKRMKYLYNSQMIYAKKYLGASDTACNFVRVSQVIGFSLYSLYWKFRGTTNDG